MGLFDCWGYLRPLNTPALLSQNYTKAVYFTTSVDGNIVGLKWAVATNGTIWDQGNKRAAIWKVSGTTRLGFKDFTTLTPGYRWQDVYFDTPIALTAGESYLAAVTQQAGVNGVYTCGAAGGQISRWSSPLSCSITGGYTTTTPNTFPATPDSFWFGIDVWFDDLGNFTPNPDYTLLCKDTRRVNGHVQGVNLGGCVDPYGHGGFGRYLQTGVAREAVEGNPAAPSLALKFPGMWRFRWGVDVGTQTISINVKQTDGGVGMRPRLIVKADPECGVNADVVGTASAGSGWVTIGPLSVTATSPGQLWVELWNRDGSLFNNPAYFDHAVAVEPS